MADFGTTFPSLFATVRKRRESGDAEHSYVAKLSARGRTKIAQKLGEEAVETVIEAMRDDKGKVISESADLLFHLAILWADMGITPDDVAEELQRREGTSGIEEKRNRN